MQVPYDYVVWTRLLLIGMWIFSIKRSAVCVMWDGVTSRYRRSDQILFIQIQEVTESNNNLILVSWYQVIFWVNIVLYNVLCGMGPAVVCRTQFIVQPRKIVLQCMSCYVSHVNVEVVHFITLSKESWSGLIFLCKQNSDYKYSVVINLNILTIVSILNLQYLT